MLQLPPTTSFETLDLSYVPALGVSPPDITIFDPHDCKTAFEYVCKEYFPMMLGPQLSPSPLFSSATMQRTALPAGDSLPQLDRSVVEGLQALEDYEALASTNEPTTENTSTMKAPPSQRAVDIFRQGRRRRGQVEENDENDEEQFYPVAPPRVDTLHDAELLLPQEIRAQLPLLLTTMEAGTELKAAAARSQQKSSTFSVPTSSKLNPSGNPKHQAMLEQLDHLRVAQLATTPSETLRTNITDLAKSHSLVTPRFSRCADSKAFLLDGDKSFYLHVFLLPIKSYDKKRYALDEAIKWLKVIEQQQRDRTGGGSASPASAAATAAAPTSTFGSMFSPTTPRDAAATTTSQAGTASTTAGENSPNGDLPTKRLNNFIILLVHPLLMRPPANATTSEYSSVAAPSSLRATAAAAPSTTAEDPAKRKDRGFSLFSSKKSEADGGVATSAQGGGMSGTTGADTSDGAPAKPSVFSSAFNSIFSSKNPVAEAEERMKEFEQFFNSQAAFTGKVFRFHIDRTRGTMQTFMVNSYASWDAELKRRMRVTLLTRHLPGWSVQDLWAVQREMVVNYLRFGLLEEAMSGISSMFSSAQMFTLNNNSSSSSYGLSSSTSPQNNNSRQRILPPRNRLSARSPQSALPSPAGDSVATNRNASSASSTQHLRSSSNKIVVGGDEIARQDSDGSNQGTAGGRTTAASGGLVTFSGVTTTIPRTPSDSSASTSAPHSNSTSRTASGTFLSTAAPPVHPRISAATSSAARPSSARHEPQNMRRCDLLRSEFLRCGGGGDGSSSAYAHDNDENDHQYQPDHGLGIYGENAFVMHLNRELQHLVRVVRVSDVKLTDPLEACCAVLLSSPTPSKGSSKSAQPPIDRVLSAGLLDMLELLQATSSGPSPPSKGSTKNATQLNRNMFSVVDSPSVEIIRAVSKSRPATSRPFVDPSSNLKTIFNFAAAEMHLSLLCGQQQTAMQRLTSFVECVEDTALATVLPGLAQFLEGQVELLRDAYREAGHLVADDRRDCKHTNGDINENPFAALFGPLTTSFSETSPSTAALAELLNIHRDACTLLQSPPLPPVTSPSNEEATHEPYAHHHHGNDFFALEAAVMSTRISVIVVRRVLALVYLFLFRVAGDGLEFCVGFAELLHAEVELTANVNGQQKASGSPVSSKGVIFSPGSFRKGQSGSTTECVSSFLSVHDATTTTVVGTLSNPTIYNSAVSASVNLQKDTPATGGMVSPMSGPLPLDFSSTAALQQSLGSPFTPGGPGFKHFHSRTFSGQGVPNLSPGLNPHVRTASAMSNFDRTGSGMILDAPVHVRTTSLGHHQRVPSGNGTVSPTMLGARRPSDGNMHRHMRQMSTHSGPHYGMMGTTPLSVVHTPRSPNDGSISASMAGDYDYYLGGGGGSEFVQQYSTFAYNDPLLSYNPVGLLGGFDFVDDADIFQTGDAETAYYYGNADAVRRRASTQNLMQQRLVMGGSVPTQYSQGNNTNNDGSVLEDMSTGERVDNEHRGGIRNGADGDSIARRFQMSASLLTPFVEYEIERQLTEVVSTLRQQDGRGGNPGFVPLFSTDPTSPLSADIGSGSLLQQPSTVTDTYTPHSWWKLQQYYLHEAEYAARRVFSPQQYGSNSAQIPRPQSLDTYLKEEGQRVAGTWSGTWLTEIRALERLRWGVLTSVGELAGKMKGYLELLSIVTLGVAVNPKLGYAHSLEIAPTNKPHAAREGYAQFINIVPFLDAESGLLLPPCLTSHKAVRRAMWHLTTLGAACFGNNAAICRWASKTASPASSMSAAIAWDNDRVRLDLWSPPSVVNLVALGEDGSALPALSGVGDVRVGADLWLLESVSESPSPLHALIALVRFGVHSSCASDAQMAVFGAHRRPRVALQLLSSGVQQILQRDAPNVASQLLLQVIVPAFLELYKDSIGAASAIHHVLNFWNGLYDNMGRAFSSVPSPSECAAFMRTPLLQHRAVEEQRALPLLVPNLLAILVDSLLVLTSGNNATLSIESADDTSGFLQQNTFLVTNILLYMARTSMGGRQQQARRISQSKKEGEPLSTTITAPTTSAVKERLQKMFEEAFQHHVKKERAERLRDEAEIGVTKDKATSVALNSAASEALSPPSFTASPSMPSLTSTNAPWHAALVPAATSMQEAITLPGQGAWGFLLSTLLNRRRQPNLMSSKAPLLPLSSVFTCLKIGFHVEVTYPNEHHEVVSSRPPEVLELSPLFSSKPTDTSNSSDNQIGHPTTAIIPWVETKTVVELQLDFVIFDGFEETVSLKPATRGARSKRSNNYNSPPPAPIGGKPLEMTLEVVLEGNGLEGLDQTNGGPMGGASTATLFAGRNTSGRPFGNNQTMPECDEILGSFGSAQSACEGVVDLSAGGDPRDELHSSSTLSNASELYRTQGPEALGWSGNQIKVSDISRFEFLDGEAGCRVLRVFMPVTEARELDSSSTSGSHPQHPLLSVATDPRYSGPSSSKTFVSRILSPGSYGLRSLNVNLMPSSSTSSAAASMDGSTAVISPSATAPMLCLEKVYECCLFTDDEVRQGLEEVNRQLPQVELNDFHQYCVDVSEDHDLFAHNTLLAELSPGILFVPQPEVGADLKISFPKDAHPTAGCGGYAANSGDRPHSPSPPLGLPTATISLTFSRNPTALAKKIDAALSGSARGDVALIHVGERAPSVTAAPAFKGYPMNNTTSNLNVSDKGIGGGGGGGPMCNLVELPLNTDGQTDNGMTNGSTALLLFEGDSGEHTLVPPTNAFAATSSTPCVYFHDAVRRIVEGEEECSPFPFAPNQRLTALEDTINENVMAVCAFDPQSTTLPSAAVSVTTPQTSLLPRPSFQTVDPNTPVGTTSSQLDPDVIIRQVLQVRLIPLTAGVPQRSANHHHGQQQQFNNVALTSVRTLIRSNSVAKLNSAASPEHHRSTDVSFNSSVNPTAAALTMATTATFVDDGVTSPLTNSSMSPLLRKPSAFAGAGSTSLQRRHSKVRLPILGEMVSNSHLALAASRQLKQDAATDGGNLVASTSMLVVVSLNVAVLKRLTHREVNLLKQHLKSIEMEIPVLPEMVSTGLEQSTAEWMAKRNRATKMLSSQPNSMNSSFNGTGAQHDGDSFAPPHASPRVVENMSFARRVGSTVNNGGGGFVSGLLHHQQRSGEVYQSFIGNRRSNMIGNSNANFASTSNMFLQPPSFAPSTAQSPRGISASSRGLRLLQTPPETSRREATDSGPLSAPTSLSGGLDSTSFALSGGFNHSTLFSTTAHPSLAIHKHISSSNKQPKRYHSDEPEATDWGTNTMFPYVQSLGKIPLSFALLTNLNKEGGSGGGGAAALEEGCIQATNSCNRHAALEMPTFKDAAFPGLVAPFTKAIDTTVSYVILPARGGGKSPSTAQQSPIQLSGQLDGGGVPLRSSTRASSKHSATAAGDGLNHHRQTIVAKVIVSNVLADTPILISHVDLVVLPRSLNAPQSANRKKAPGGERQGANLALPTLNFNNTNFRKSTGQGLHDANDVESSTREIVDGNGVVHLDAIPQAVFLHYGEGGKYGGHNGSGGDGGDQQPHRPLRVSRRIGAVFGASSSLDNSANAASSSATIKSAKKAAAATSSAFATNRDALGCRGGFSRPMSLLPAATFLLDAPVSPQVPPKKEAFGNNVPDGVVASNPMILLPGCSTTVVIELQVDSEFVPSFQREHHYARALVSYQLFNPSCPPAAIPSQEKHKFRNNNLYLSSISHLKTAHLSVFSVLLRPLSPQEAHQALLHNSNSTAAGRVLLNPTSAAALTPTPQSSASLRFTVNGSSPSSNVDHNPATGSPLRELCQQRTPPHCWGVVVGLPCYFDLTVRPDSNNQGLLQQELRAEASRHFAHCAICKKHLLKAIKWVASTSSIGGNTKTSSGTEEPAMSAVADPSTFEVLLPMMFQVLLEVDSSQWVLSGRTISSFTFPLRLVTPAYKLAKRDYRKRKNNNNGGNPGSSSSPFPPPARVQFAALPVAAGVIDTPTAVLRRAPVEDALHKVIADFVAHTRQVSADDQLRLESALGSTAKSKATTLTTTSNKAGASSSIASGVSPTPSAIRPQSQKVATSGSGSMRIVGSSGASPSPRREESGESIGDDSRSIIFDDNDDMMDAKSEGDSSSCSGGEYFDVHNYNDDDDEDVARGMFHSNSNSIDVESVDEEEDYVATREDTNERLLSEDSATIGNSKPSTGRRTSRVTLITTTTQQPSATNTRQGGKKVAKNKTVPVAASVVCTREKFFGLDAAAAAFSHLSSM